jgi:chemotaxis family two-component system response regulator Rcp1
MTHFSTNPGTKDNPFNLLLVEDNPGDVNLVQEALRASGAHHILFSVPDGIEAMLFLRHQGKYVESPVPDLIMLDLNLPRKDGREVLKEIKSDEHLKHLLVIVISSSGAASDLRQVYELQANCMLTKPTDLDDFFAMVESMNDFWLNFARLPLRGS